MNTLFTTALIAAYAQAQSIFEDSAVARQLGSDGRQLSEFDSADNEGRMLAAAMDEYEGRMLSSSDRSLSHSSSVSNDTRKTYKGGRNRKSGLYYRNGNYCLASSIIVARAGETDAGVAAPAGLDIIDPYFATADRSLTEVGAKTMNDIGVAIAKDWTYQNDTKKHWVDFSAYKASEVFAYAGSTDRMNDSAIALLDGLYGAVPSAVPITDDLATSTVYPNSAKPAAADDLLMNATPADSCARIGLLNAEIAANADTVALKTKITTFLEDKYFPRLKTLLANDALTNEQLYEVAGIIDTAVANGITLQIGPNDSALTPTELNYNKVAVDADNYEELALTRDQWIPQTQELQQLMLEVSKMVKKELAVEDSVIAKKYWPTQTAALGAEVPKLLPLVGDEETIKSLLGTFENLYADTPAPGSLFAVDFYAYKYDTRYVYVEVSYCPDGDDIDGSCTLLQYDSPYRQDSRGWNKSTNFEHFVQHRLDDFELDNSFATDVTAADVCAAAVDTAKLSDYQDTSRFYTDLLTSNDFEEAKPDPVIPDHGHHHGGSSDHHHRPSPWCRWPWW